MEEESTKKENIKFFKKVWYSVNKIEKYSELASEGLLKTIIYLVKLLIILVITVAGISVYRVRNEIKEIAQYINQNAPEFTYSDNILEVNSDERIIDENEIFGKIVIDTKGDEKEMLNEIEEDENGIVISKNAMIIKDIGKEEKHYTYQELFEKMDITEFNKEKLVEYLIGSKMNYIYLGLFVSMFIYSFIVYFVNTIINILAISIFGYISALITKLKVRYVAVFNMATYSITLATILNMLYVILGGIFNYQIRYFDIMYTLVSAIYMIAAIFLIKIDTTKKQEQIKKIVKVEKEIKEEIKEKEENQKEEKNKDTNKKQNKKEKKKEEEELEGGEPEGSNA